jgi:hypothetical protein
MLVVLALALGACTDDRVRPSDTLPSTSESPPTTSESPTATASSGPNGVVPIPTPNPLASEQSETGAIAFNEYWTMTLDYLYATLDVEPFREVSSPDCSFCTYVIDRLGPRREQGYVYEGGRITIEGSVVNSFDGASASVTTIVRVTELVVTNPQGNRDPDSGPAYPAFQLLNQLSWTGQGWLVLDAKGGEV